MKLKTTRQEYRHEDPSGYSFEVSTSWDNEFGWDAVVSFSSRGYANSDAAINGLREACRRFLQSLDEERTPAGDAAVREMGK